MRIFPIRHHSPASALLLERSIEADPPRRILVEGPSDADALIPVLLDEGTEPPVAILAWRPGGPTAIYPFAPYSPEYVALRAAKRLAIPARFFDIPASTAMDRPESETAPADLEREICARLGYGSYEEFWEASFEAGGMDAETFARLFLDYARLMRKEPGRIPELDRLREAFMAREIAREPVDGTLVVCGAFHAAALADGEADPAAAPEPGPRAEVAVIPYSFARLSEQAGYGAGNRAPRFYQRVHGEGGDFRRASLATVLDLSARLRERGWGGGTADAIDAYRLARSLGAMRGRSAPGLDEVREAATACLLQGNPAPLRDLLGESAIGRETGRVASRLARSPLQDEFYAEARRFALPIVDEPRVVKAGREASAFLHRLKIAEIPYATLVGEKWRVRWTPATDAALLRRIEMGATLREVCGRVIESRLPAARSAGQAAELAWDAGAADLPDVLARAIARCADLAAEDRDLHSLAVAARRIGDDALRRAILARALLLLPEAARVSDDGASAVCEALRVLAGSPGFDEAFRRVLRDELAHPRAAGLALALLRRSMSDDERLSELSFRLSADPSAARFLEGFLSAGWRTLIRDRELVSLLDRFIESMGMDRFLKVLPVLRRAFSNLTPAEARRLVERVVEVRSGATTLPSRKAEAETAESLALAIREAERTELAAFVPLRLDPVPVRCDRFEDLLAIRDRYIFPFAVMDYCARASVEEMRRTRDRLWSDSSAAPLVVAALRKRPDTLAIVEDPPLAPIAARTAVELCRARPDSERVLRRLAAGPLPVCRWAEEALAERGSPAQREAYRHRCETLLREHDDDVRSARRAEDPRDRAAAVARLRDPLFVPVLREAARDPDESVRNEAALSLAFAGDDSLVEEWMAHRRVHLLAILGAEIPGRMP